MRLFLQLTGYIGQLKGDGSHKLGFLVSGELMKNTNWALPKGVIVNLACACDKRVPASRGCFARGRVPHSSITIGWKNGYKWEYLSDFCSFVLCSG